MSIAGGVTVFCDPTLKPAVTALDGLGGVKVAALSAPAALMLAQIVRHTRNDILFTLSVAMDQAVRAGLVRPGTRVDGFSNPLVLAALADRVATPVTQANLASMLRRARIAVTDDTPAAGLDGRAVLAANGIARQNTAGRANTGDVVFALGAGEAEIGLVYLTDVKADPRLAVIATLAADPALTAYSAAVNAKAFSPNAQGLLNQFRGNPVLQAAGLTVPA
jgi:molybdate transport system substrate-binding protein